MNVKNHFLFEDNGKQVPFKQTPNHGGLKKSIKFIVIHYDASTNSTGAVSWMVTPKSDKNPNPVSAEVHITRDGKTTQLLPFNLTAWHAGKSEWKGFIGLNSYAIGIELQNAGTQEYTGVQLDELAEVCRALVKEYDTIEEIVGHSDISPGRKIDPGKQFPMAWLRDQVFKTASIEHAIKVDVKSTTSDLNIRAGAGTSFKIISTLPKGTIVNVLSIENNWSNVYVPKSKLTGWVSSQYIK